MHDHDVAAVVARDLPGYTVEAIVRLGEGLDNVAYEVNGELIVRFAKEPDPQRRAETVAREARLLDVVGQLSPLPVPEPVLVAPDDGCLAYRRLPGVPLATLPDPTRVGQDFAAAVAGFLARLHATPVDRVSELVDVDIEPLEEWLRWARADYGKVAAHVPAPVRPRIEAFLASPPPAGDAAPVFCHNDLGAEHVLVDPTTRTATGVIDWADAALADPAYDLGLLFRDCGPGLLDALLAHGGVGGAGGGGPALRERAVFYGRCTVFEDLAYGIATGGRTYVDNSLAALAWLFPG